jgi:hypothetical protein
MMKIGRVQYNGLKDAEWIAGRSGHYIHHDEPDIVIEEIMIMLKGMGK